MLHQRIGTSDQSFGYQKMGHGKTPVVLLHGFGNHSAMWYPFLPGRLGECTFYLVDFPGFGASKNVGGETHNPLGVYRTCVESLLESQNLTGVALVGFSLGAYVGLSVVAANPGGRIARYLHIDHPPFAQNTADWRGGLPPDLLRTFGELCTAVADSPASPDLADCDLTTLPKNVYEIYRRVMDEIGEKSLTIELSKKINHLLHQAPVLRDWIIQRAEWRWGYPVIRTYYEGSQDFRPLLSKVAVPVTIFCGAKSQICNEVAVDCLARGLPRREIIRFEKSGHDLILNEPRNFRTHFQQFCQPR